MRTREQNERKRERATECNTKDIVERKVRERAKDVKGRQIKERHKNNKADRKECNRGKHWSTTGRKRKENK